MTPELRKMAEEAGLFEVWGAGISEGDMCAFISSLAGLIAGDCAKMIENCVYSEDAIHDIRAKYGIK